MRNFTTNTLKMNILNSPSNLHSCDFCNVEFDADFYHYKGGISFSFFTLDFCKYCFAYKLDIIFKKQLLDNLTKCSICNCDTNNYTKYRFKQESNNNFEFNISVCNGCSIKNNANDIKKSFVYINKIVENKKNDRNITVSTVTNIPIIENEEGDGEGDY
jgi:hypothetical protein